ncbi:MAG: hypothetical protein AAF290_12570 [Pseudomonadota bacterium]
MSNRSETDGNAHAVQMTTRYDALWREYLPALQQGDVLVDRALAAAAPDQRRGLSLIIRPARQVCAQIDAASRFFASDESGVWPYAVEQLHVTALTLVSCRAGFCARDIDLRPLLAALSRSMQSIEPFEIVFRGITATNEAIMAQGFADDSIVASLRGAISSACDLVGLAALRNQRYDHVTAHCTMQRFSGPLLSPAEYCQKLMRYRSRQFGQSLVSRLVLVENDWFHRPDSVLELAELPLAGS